MNKSILLFIMIYLNIGCICNGVSNEQLEETKTPIVYSEGYNISFLGLENLHPFDSKKYGRVFEMLSDNKSLTLSKIHKPEPITDEELLKVHTKEYLDSLEKSSTVAQIAEMNLLKFVPNTLLQKMLLGPMRLATTGSLIGVDLALEHGWGINLSGGYHHAKSNSGEGFCFFADIPLAVKKIHHINSDYKVLIIDLDAHQGNGVSTILQSVKNVDILDVYNFQIYPNDKIAERYVTYNYPVNAYIQDDEYLFLIENKVPEAIEASKADFIIYNAGTDIYAEDPLGAMSISHAGIIKRDEIVFKNAVKRNIPILMLLSGGYTKDSARIIADSIENLMNNILPVSN